MCLTRKEREKGKGMICAYNWSILEGVLLSKCACLFNGKDIHTIYLFNTRKTKEHESQNINILFPTSLSET